MAPSSLAQSMASLQGTSSLSLTKSTLFPTMARTTQYWFITKIFWPVVPELSNPCFHSIKGISTIDIIDHHCHLGVPIVNPRYSLILLLAGSIPELEFDAFAIIGMCFLKEDGPQGRVHKIVELVIHESDGDTALADPDAADNDDLGLPNHINNYIGKMIADEQGALSYLSDLTKSMHKYGSESKQFSELIAREKSGLQANLRKHSRHKSHISELTANQQKRVQELQAKLESKIQKTNRKREDVILKTVKRCKVHSRFVKKKLEKSMKADKTETNRAVDNLKTFNKTMEQFWQERKKSQMDKEKEVYWKYVCKTQQGNVSAGHEDNIQNQDNQEVSFFDNKHSTSLKHSLTREPVSNQLRGVSFALPSGTNITTTATKTNYTKKYQDVKSLANKLYVEKQQEIFQKYAEKMQAIDKIKNKKNKQQDEQSNPEDQSRSQNGFMLTQAAHLQQARQRHIVVRSLQKPKFYFSTQMNRAIDHSRQNLLNRRRLQTEMMQQHDDYIQEYTNRLQHVKALKQLRQQLHQKKLYYSRR